jgi:hypothetical protein
MKWWIVPLAVVGMFLKYASPSTIDKVLKKLLRINR